MESKGWGRRERGTLTCTALPLETSKSQPSMVGGVVSKAWRTPRNSRFTPVNQPLLRCLVSVLGNSCMLFQKIIITMLREALLCLQLAMQSAHFHRTETSRTICLFSRTLTFPILPFNK